MRRRVGGRLFTLGRPRGNLPISLRPTPHASVPHSPTDTYCPWACADGGGCRAQSPPRRTTARRPSLRPAPDHIGRGRPSTARGRRHPGALPRSNPLRRPPPQRRNPLAHRAPHRGCRRYPPELHLGSSAMRDSCASSRGHRRGRLEKCLLQGPPLPPTASPLRADLVGAVHPESASDAGVLRTFASCMGACQDGWRGAATLCATTTSGGLKGSRDLPGRTEGSTEGVRSENPVSASHRVTHALGHSDDTVCTREVTGKPGKYERTMF